MLGVCLVGAVSTMVGWAGAKPSAPPDGKPAGPVVRTYVVTSGDTLWRIAVGLVGRGEDPRPMVQRLTALNGIRDGVIVPGQRLALP